MMPVSRRVEGLVPTAPPAAARRSPNSGSLVIAVATSFVLVSALASLISEPLGRERTGTIATLGLRGSLPALADPSP